MQISQRTRDMLVVATHAPPAQGWGGAMVTAATRAGIFARLGVDVELVASSASRDGPPISPAAAEHAVGIPVTLYASKHKPAVGFSIAAIPLLFDAVRRSRSVFISGVFTWPVTVAAWLAIALRKPFAITSHGGLLRSHLLELREGKRLKWLIFRWAVLPTIRKATMLCASSEFEARDLALLSRADRVVTIPNTRDLSTVPFAATRKGREGRHLLYVGRIEKDKGIRRFAEIWLKAAGELDTLTIVGSGQGRYFDDLVSLSLSDARLRLHGELSRAQTYDAMAACDFLVLPSGIEGTLRENFGNVVVECLAVGRPVLVSRGLAWDALPEAGLGLTFDETDASIAEAIEECRAMEVGPEIAEKCRAYATRNFDTAHSLDKFAVIAARLGVPTANMGSNL